MADVATIGTRQSMKHLCKCILLIWACGCQSELQAYIEEHTELEVTYGDEYQITLKLETDADDSFIGDFIWVQKQINDTVIPDDSGLSSFQVFIPSSEDSYVSARRCLSGGSERITMAFIAPGSKTIVLNPKMIEEKPYNYVVETYIHELMHYVALKLDGDIDANHSNLEYWGDNGLVDQIFQDYLDNHP